MVGHINELELDLKGNGRLLKDFRLRDDVAIFIYTRWIQLLCWGSKDETQVTSYLGLTGKTLVKFHSSQKPRKYGK